MEAPREEILTGSRFFGATSRLEASARDRRDDRRGVFWEKMSENSKIGERDVKRVGVSRPDLRVWIIIVDIRSPGQMWLLTERASDAA